MEIMDGFNCHLTCFAKHLVNFHGVDMVGIPLVYAVGGKTGRKG
jgi:hypothetical protein